ncbi:MAG: AI-2E family transporter [Hyphomicrobiales bacterium]|nr:AI-2E family transporter [Hyphomicrobiales bacterium]MBV9428626.1 AI-2E family transporter [Bradyrhizobiaceae bacterium]
MNEAPTERSAGLPRRALAAARPFLVKSDAVWTGVARAATIGIFLLLLAGALDLARVLFLPLVSALVFAFIFGPLQVAAARRRVPGWLFALGCVVALIAIINLIIILTAAPLIEWLGRGPDIAKSLGDKLRILAGPFSAVQDLQRALSPGSAKVGMNIEVTTFITPALAFLTPALGELVVFFAALFFFLVGRNHMRRHVVLFFPSKEDRLRALRVLNEIEDNLTRYLATTGAINLCLGFIVGCATWIIGLPNPVMWGVLAFAFNFLPYVGPLIITIALFVAGLVVFPALGPALIAPAFFVGLTTLEGHFITPNIVGRRLALSPVLVFVGLVFWTWLWGPMGALLATPLVIIGTVIADDLLAKNEIELPE